MFGELDRSLLDDDTFKEDSVRELIITPILSRLGFGPSGENRVIRSKSLSHPFIYAGTRKVPVNLIQDYTLLCNEKPLLVLDAKRPTEDILSRENVQQAYSYAIHPEVKCQHFGLCNGKRLAVFDVDNSTPLLLVEFHEYDSRWEEIERYLSPRFLKEPALRRFAPDLGFAFSRLGLKRDAKIVMFGVQLNLFARMSDDLMSASSNCEFAEKAHMASFDFHPALLSQIVSGLPKALAEAFSNALNRYPFQAAAELAIEVDVEMRLGEEIQVQTETFIPLVIEKVLASRFNHSPIHTEASDIPENVFRLRRAYAIRRENLKPD